MDTVVNDTFSFGRGASSPFETFELRLETNNELQIPPTEETRCQTFADWWRREKHAAAAAAVGGHREKGGGGTTTAKAHDDNTTSPMLTRVALQAQQQNK